MTIQITEGTRRVLAVVADYEGTVTENSIAAELGLSRPAVEAAVTDLAENELVTASIRRRFGRSVGVTEAGIALLTELREQDTLGLDASGHVVTGYLGEGKSGEPGYSISEVSLSNDPAADALHQLLARFRTVDQDRDLAYLAYRQADDAWEVVARELTKFVGDNPREAARLLTILSQQQ